MILCRGQLPLSFTPPSSEGVFLCVSASAVHKDLGLQVGFACFRNARLNSKLIRHNDQTGEYRIKFLAL